MRLSLKKLVSIYGKAAGNLIWQEQNADFIRAMVQVIKRRERLKNLIPKHGPK